jgi:hypothetical protein
VLGEGSGSVLHGVGVKIVFDFFLRTDRDMEWQPFDYMMMKMQLGEWIWSLRS